MDALVMSCILIVQERGSESVLTLVILECLYHLFSRESVESIITETTAAERLKSALGKEKLKRSSWESRVAGRHSKFGGSIFSRGIVRCA
jgi:hypothetical protein